MYQLDQSIKIENTSQATYVCLTNGHSVTVSINAKDKRNLKVFYRKINKPLTFKLFTFSVLCAKTIQKIKPDSVIIDQEYKGHERQIKSFILQIFRINHSTGSNIHFSEIGKHSPAHLNVYAAMHHKKSTLKISSLEVISLYGKISKK
jgi:hypothetical protein